MKVCGFTIIRNAIKYDYPVIESITSVLPICDKFIVLVGNSDDDTLSLIQSIHSDKIEIHHSIWDDNLREGGRVLAEETNKAFDLITLDYDWALYIQSDELIHEKYHSVIVDAMQLYADNQHVEGLLFKYMHFYASYDYIGTSRQWYRQEIRIIKNDKSIRSYKDAQGFRKNGQKLKVAPIDAYIFHYGWVKDPVIQMKKVADFQRLWHDDHVVNQYKAMELFDYENIDQLKKFEGSHPVTILNRVREKNWNFDATNLKGKTSFKNKILQRIESITGIRLFEYRNFKIIKP